MRKILSLFLLLTITASAQVQLCMKPVAGTRTVLAGDASVTFTLADNPLYMVDVCQLVPGTDNAALYMTVNAETASYEWHHSWSDSGAPTYDGRANVTTNSLELALRVGSSTGEGLGGGIFVPNASSASLYKPIWGQLPQVDRDTVTRHNTIAGYWSGGTTAITSITLEPSTGTFATGNMQLWELALYKTSDVGKTYGPCTLISRTDASAVDTVDLSLGNYKRHVAVLLGVVLSVDGAELFTQIGTSGGVKASMYARHMNLSASSSSSYAANNSASSGTLQFPSNLGNVGGENFCQVIEIPNPSGQYKIISTQGAYINNGGNATMCNGSGAWKGGTDQLTTCRAYPSSGTITGTILWFGIN